MEEGFQEAKVKVNRFHHGDHEGHRETHLKISVIFPGTARAGVCSPW